MRHDGVAVRNFVGSMKMKTLALAACLAVFAMECGTLQGKTAQMPRAVSTNTTPGMENPVAAPGAVVEIGHARFSVLTSRLIRMEWAQDGVFENHASLVFLNRNLPVPKFTQHISIESGVRVLHLDTRALHLTYRDSPVESGMFSASNLQIQFSFNGKPVNWHPGMPNPGNLMGTTRTLDGANGDATREPIGQGLLSRDGWDVVDDTETQLFDSTDFRFAEGENSPWPWVMERPSGKRQDWYFFGYGHDYKAELSAYIKVAGRIPLPPYFAFGAWWSRYWPYSDQEFHHLVRDFRRSDIPLDVLVIDMDWHPTARQLLPKGKVDQSGQNLGWTGFSWNRLLFPDPQAFLSGMHQEGLNVTLNLHPASGVQPWETRYPEMARAMGIDPASGKYVPFDITNKKFAENFMTIMHHPLEKQGVRFWWLDWQQGSKTAIPGLNPTWWLNYVYFTDQAREGKRPILFGRWGGLGNHRYQVGFSGDVVSTWKSLAFQPWFTANAANVGYAYWSHDIGGHIPGVDSPELFTRWVQFGVFSPILRTHSSPDPNAERRIWAYPEPYSDIMRNAYHLRYALIPYIYTEARRTYDTGVAFLHPLYYDWPESNDAYDARNEYMFGSEMLAAPVTAPQDPNTGLASETIWLPKGDWIEVATGKRLHGPARMTRQFSIDQIPIYVRPGAIVPMAPPMQWTGQKPVNPLTVTVFPLQPGTSSKYTLYQDAGDSLGYQSDKAAWTTIHARQQGGDLTVEIDPAQGSYRGMQHERKYVFRLPDDWPPDSVFLNGKPIVYEAAGGQPGWSYDGDTLTAIIRVGAMPTDAPVILRVHRSERLVKDRDELDGFAGALSRLHQTSLVIDGTVPLAWRPDALVDAMQTGDRIRYRPDTIQREIADFPAKLQAASESVRALQDNAQAAQKRILSGKARYYPQPIVEAHQKQLVLEQIDKYKQAFSKMMAMMQDARADVAAHSDGLALRK